MTSVKPNMIYRYQKFNARSLEALCNDQLYFSDPIKFNDPLDCKPSVTQDSDKETLRMILTSLIYKKVEDRVLDSLKAAKINSNKGRKHAEKQAKQAAANELRNVSYNATNPEYEVSVDEAECFLLTAGIQHELLKQNNRGVCCFSSDYANPLLWSHYGDQHNGFCVGYSLDRKPSPAINKVLYGGSRTVKTSLIAKAILNGDKEAQKELDGGILLRKAAPWKYEKEWRVFDRVGLQDSPLRLEEVIFGLRCSPPVMHAVMSALGSRNIKFFHIFSVKNGFKLKRSSDVEEWCHHLPRTSYSGEELFGSVTI